MEILELRCSNVSSWHDDIHRVTKECVKDVNEAQVEVIYENETAYLGIHWSDGLRLYKLPNRKVVWHKSVQLLSLIDDDNHANLTLAFKDNSKVFYHSNISLIVIMVDKWSNRQNRRKMV